MPSMTTLNRDEAPWKNLAAGEQYCPICRMVVVAYNIEEVASGEHDSYVFVHRNIDHYADELMALSAGIQ